MRERVVITKLEREKDLYSTEEDNVHLETRLSCTVRGEHQLYKSERDRIIIII